MTNHLFTHPFHYIVLGFKGLNTELWAVLFISCLKCRYYMWMFRFQTIQTNFLTSFSSNFLPKLLRLPHLICLFLVTFPSALLSQATCRDMFHLCIDSHRFRLSHSEWEHCIILSYLLPLKSVYFHSRKSRNLCSIPFSAPLRLQLPPCLHATSLIWLSSIWHPLLSGLLKEKRSMSI